MSKPGFSFSIAALSAVLGLLLTPGGAANPPKALAADCTQGQTGTLVIRIYDQATNALLPFSGAEVLINPDPRDFDLDHIVVDSDVDDASGAEDKEPGPGVIRLDRACSTQGAETYAAILFSLPVPYDDCDIVSGSDSGKLAVNGTTDLDLEVDCTGIGPTPTVGPTGTPAPTATPAGPNKLSATASPLQVSCSGTSVITVAIRDGANNPVAAGTPVGLTTTFGTLSPGGAQVTNAAGNVTVFFTAPASSGGIATITAISGSLKDTASVSVQCGGVAAISSVTTAPGGAGVITPPNTGDAGIAGPDRDASRIAVLAVFAASVTAAGWWLCSTRLSGRR